VHTRTVDGLLRLIKTIGVDGENGLMKGFLVGEKSAEEISNAAMSVVVKPLELPRSCTARSVARARS
jgi:hypothetical protein